MEILGNRISATTLPATFEQSKYVLAKCTVNHAVFRWKKEHDSMEAWTKIEHYCNGTLKPLS